MGRGLVAAGFAAAFGLAAAHAVVAATPPPTVKPGERVPVPVSKNTTVLVDKCNDGYPHAGPTYSTFTIHPSDAGKLAGAPPSVESIQAGSASAVFDVSPTVTPGLIMIVEWGAAANGCYSAHGSITYVVGKTSSGGGAGGAGGTGSDGGSGAAGARKPFDGAQECRPPVKVEGAAMRVFVQDPTGNWSAAFSQVCDDARSVAEGKKVPGVTCSRAGGAAVGESYLLCTGRKVFLVLAPTRTTAGPTACGAVVERGRRYLVFKQRVLCRYARATALRMLRRQEPYVYEILFPGESQLKWSCRIVVPGPSGKLVPPKQATTRITSTAPPAERGACSKPSEGRWILYVPAAS
jgi:hypothetical protein